METALRGLLSKAYLVYLDGIIIVCRIFEEHLNNIRLIFQVLQYAHIKLIAKSVSFHKYLLDEAVWIHKRATFSKEDHMYNVLDLAETKTRKT